MSARQSGSITIASGSDVSETFQCAQARGLQLTIPELNSCSLTIEAATAITSASFRPIWSVASQTALAIRIGPGSASLLLDHMAGASFARLVTSVPQTTDRVFELVRWR